MDKTAEIISILKSDLCVNINTGNWGHYLGVDDTSIKECADKISQLFASPSPGIEQPYRLNNGETTTEYSTASPGISAEPTPEQISQPPFPERMTFREMLINLFNTDFLTPDELKTISDAGEMYTNGCLNHAASLSNLEGYFCCAELLLIEKLK